MKKNAFIFLLLVLVVVLGLLLYKCRNVRLEGDEHRKPRVKRLLDLSTNTLVDTQECPHKTGQGNKTCIIPISYLTNMGGGSDAAIVVHHNEIVIWIGDSGETIDVQPMYAIDCTDHTKKLNIQDADPSLISPITSAAGGIIQYATVTANGKNDSYCYKTNINVAVNRQQKPPIDPHLFDGGP